MILRRCAATAAALAVLSACAPTGAASTPASPALLAGDATLADTTRVSVTGTSTRSVPADRARLRVAVETEGSTAARASARNAEIMNRVVAAVREAAGISGEGDGRLETSGYRLTPRYRQDRDRASPPEIVGYQAVNQVTAVLADVDLVGPVLDAALEAGANRVAGLAFFAADTESARLEAVAEATGQARREAGIIAGALGMSVVGVESVSTSAGGGPVFRAEMDVQAAMSTPVEAGSQSVSATVNVTFLLLPAVPR